MTITIIGGGIIGRTTGVAGIAMVRAFVDNPALKA